MVSRIIWGFCPSGPRFSGLGCETGEAAGPQRLDAAPGEIQRQRLTAHGCPVRLAPERIPYTALEACYGTLLRQHRCPAERRPRSPSRRLPMDAIAGKPPAPRRTRQLPFRSSGSEETLFDGRRMRDMFARLPHIVNLVRLSVPRERLTLW